MQKFHKIVMIDNFDSFTFNLVDYLEQLGSKVQVIRNDEDPTRIEEAKPDLIVVSPGPSVPRNAGNLMKMIELTYLKYPLFGVCLGLEALVEFFGGTLKFTTPMHGKSSTIQHDGKTIFTGLKENFPAGRYHSLVTDNLPECLEVSAECGSSERFVMAVRHRTLPIEAVQFHPESVLSMDLGNGFKLMENVIHKRFANI
jgi:para-aminobenzoate synthetase component 2